MKEKQTLGGKLKKVWNKTVFSDMLKEKKENECIRREARKEARKEAMEDIKKSLVKDYKEEEMAKIKGKKKGEGLKKLAEAMGGKSGKTENSFMDKLSGKTNSQGQNILDKLGIGNSSGGSDSIVNDDKIARMLGKTDKQIMSNDKIGELGSLEHNAFKKSDKITKKLPKAEGEYFDDKIKRMLE